MLKRTIALFAGAWMLACSDTGHAQQIDRQIAQVRDGRTEIVFAAKPGTCGDGRSFISTNRDDDDGRVTIGNSRRGWDRDCVEGPVRVELTVAGGEVTKLATYVGGPARLTPTTDTRAAVDFLLDLAENGPAAVGKKAILPALLADSVEPWPRLLRIAKNDRVGTEVRKAAIFWLGQEAGDKATEGLRSLLTDEQVEIKKSAVFALSQLRGEASVTALIDVVRTSRDPEVRKSALFWLGQKDDPRVIALLEEILLK